MTVRSRCSANAPRGTTPGSSYHATVKNKQRVRADKAARAIAGYFDNPDPDLALDDLFDGVNRTAARAALIDRLRTGEVTFLDFEIFSTLFEHLGIADQLDALRAIVADRGLDPERRAIAVALLDDELRGNGTDLLTDPEDRERVLSIIWRGLILLCMQAADAVPAVTAMLDAIEGDLDAFHFIDRVRHDTGAPAALIYEEQLARPGRNPLRQAMVDALEAEPSIGSLEILERLANDPLLDADEKLHRSALTRMRTRLATMLPPPGDRGGEVTIVDREGGIVRFWFVAPAGNLVCVDTLFRPGGRIDVPMIMPDMPRTEFEKARGVGIAPVSFERAASVFLTMLTQADDALDRSATALAKTIAAIEPLPAAEPAADVPGGELAALLRREEYSSWHLLAEAQGDETFDPDMRQRAKQVFIRRVAADPAAVRELRWMCDWMSRWHLACGEERESALMARLALDLPSRFAKSPLAMLLVERTIEIVRNEEAMLVEQAMEPGEESDFDTGPQIDEPDRDLLMKEMRKVLANQLRANKPSVTRRTLERLKSEGYSDKEAKDMMAAALMVEIAGMLKMKRPYDEERLTKRLEALPRTLEW